MDFAPAPAPAPPERRNGVPAGAARGTPQAWRVIKGARDTAARSREADRESKPPGAETAATTLASPELARLKRIVARGVPNLVILFGEHRGTTLHQLAQVDPESLKRLACEARTPEIRLAAKRLVEHLGLNVERRRRLPPRGRRPGTPGPPGSGR